MGLRKFVFVAGHFNFNCGIEEFLRELPGSGKLVLDFARLFEVARGSGMGVVGFGFRFTSGLILVLLFAAVGAKPGIGHLATLLLFLLHAFVESNHGINGDIFHRH